MLNYRGKHVERHVQIAFNLLFFITSFFVSFCVTLRIFLSGCTYANSQLLDALFLLWVRQEISSKETVRDEWQYPWKLLQVCVRSPLRVNKWRDEYQFAVIKFCKRAKKFLIYCVTSFNSLSWTRFEFVIYIDAIST